jgi:DNA invertase Pin-like site-specific DNA recombinase
MSTYAYIRVSTITQSIDRQLDEIKKLNIIKNNIYIDKESGKDFSRKSYQNLKKKLRQGDLLIIKSIDRLGRNYEMIIEEWGHITKNINADILVLDMPLLDTRSQPENLVGRFISDIVLQVLSFVAENERNNIRQRQAEGIRLAKEKGMHLGRPKYCLPDNFYSICHQYECNHISIHDALKLLNMKKSTFYKYYNKFLKL